MAPALALLEFDSIACGFEAGDAMVKQAPIHTLKAGTIQPGKFLVLITGEVANVEESLTAGKEVGADHLIDEVYLPQVHPDVIRAITGDRVDMKGEALGVIETRTVAATILAADAGRKGAEVSLLEIRLGDGLGGKGFCLFGGSIADVEAAIEYSIGALPDADALVNEVVIPSLHSEMAVNVLASTRFSDRIKHGKEMIG